VSDILTHTQWHVADMHYDDTDPACDVVVVALKGLGGDYVVTCGGPKGVGLVEVITAVRAAAAAALRAAARCACCPLAHPSGGRLLTRRASGWLRRAVAWAADPGAKRAECSRASTLGSLPAAGHGAPASHGTLCDVPWWPVQNGSGVVAEHTGRRRPPVPQAHLSA
jgi:hypothetical protein